MEKLDISVKMETLRDLLVTSQLIFLPLIDSLRAYCIDGHKIIIIQDWGAQNKINTEEEFDDWFNQTFP